MKSVTTDATYDKVSSVLDKKGLNIEKMAGFGSDGASVMVGCRKGVATKLKDVSIVQFQYGGVLYTV